MSERLGKLEVTQEAIQASVRYSAQFKEIPSFTRSVLERMRREQPELYGYIKIAAKASGRTDVLAYALGASLSYEILPKSHTQKPLTTDEIYAMHHTFIEFAETEVEDEQQKDIIELSWFIDKLEEDSPIFAEWLAESVTIIEDIEGKKNFIMGAIHVVLPFYRRGEAKELEQSLCR